MCCCRLPVTRSYRVFPVVWTRAMRWSLGYAVQRSGIIPTNKWKRMKPNTTEQTETKIPTSRKKSVPLNNAPTRPEPGLRRSPRS